MNSTHANWLSLNSTPGVSLFGAVDLAAERGGFPADASSIFGEIGPELHFTMRRIRAYGVALVGLGLIHSNSTFKPFDLTYDWDHVDDLTWVSATGGGIRYPVSARFTMDLGLRQELTGAVVWERNPQGTVDGSTPPAPIEYRRRLKSQTWHVGVRFMP